MVCKISLLLEMIKILFVPLWVYIIRDPDVENRAELERAELIAVQVAN